MLIYELELKLSTTMFAKYCRLSNIQDTFNFRCTLTNDILQSKNKTQANKIDIIPSEPPSVANPYFIFYWEIRITNYVISLVLRFNFLASVQ